MKKLIIPLTAAILAATTISAKDAEAYLISQYDTATQTQIVQDAPSSDLWYMSQDISISEGSKSVEGWLDIHGMGYNSDLKIGIMELSLKNTSSDPNAKLCSISLPYLNDPTPIEIAPAGLEPWLRTDNPFTNILFYSQVPEEDLVSGGYTFTPRLGDTSEVKDISLLSLDKHAIRYTFRDDNELETMVNCPTAAVPEPITLTLLGTGLIGIGYTGRKRLNSKNYRK